MGLCPISFSKFNSQKQRNLGLWKKVVHSPSTAFPPLRFVNKILALYIDFWPKYFQTQLLMILFIQIFSYPVTVCKKWTFKNILEKFMWVENILVKSLYKELEFCWQISVEKSCWGGMYYFFPGALIFLSLEFKTWKAYGA